MYLFSIERPSALASACPLVPSFGIKAHAHVVGVASVAGAGTGGVRLLDGLAQTPRVAGSRPTALAKHETVQATRTQARKSWRLTDQRSNGFAAKAIGMDRLSVIADGKVSGVPPRGKPV